MRFPLCFLLVCGVREFRFVRSDCAVNDSHQSWSTLSHVSESSILHDMLHHFCYNFHTQEVVFPSVSSADPSSFRDPFASSASILLPSLYLFAAESYDRSRVSPSWLSVFLPILESEAFPPVANVVLSYSSYDESHGDPALFAQNQESFLQPLLSTLQSSPSIVHSNDTDSPVCAKNGVIASSFP